MKPMVICLMGPTASGKTDLSLCLAQELNCEIISVDSAMVYQTMDIGTAKPSKEIRDQIPHHLIDLNDPAQPYSAAQFQQDALSLISTIHRKNKIPLLVGGTMLYYKALQQGLSPLPSANGEIRARLSEEANRIGWSKMHQRLASIDPIAAKRICSTDPQRIQRALEVYELTGKPLSTFFNQTHYSLPFHCINIAVTSLDRTILHERIANRFYAMLEQGFVAEVNKLFLRQDLHIDLPAIRSVGYRQVWQYLENEIPYSEMCEKGIAATRQLAKRQLTWLRQWDPIEWFDSENSNFFTKVLQYIKNLDTNR